MKVPEAEGPMRWGRALLRTPEGPGTAASVWGGRTGEPMEVEETLAEGGGLGPAGVAPVPPGPAAATPPGPAVSWGREGCEAERARTFWLRPAACSEWVLLCAALRWVGLPATPAATDPPTPPRAACTSDSWDPEGTAASGLDTDPPEAAAAAAAAAAAYWKVRALPAASGLCTGGDDRAEAKAPTPGGWPCRGDSATGLARFWTTWKRRTMRGDWSVVAAEGPTSGLAICGQKLMATACWRVAMAEPPAPPPDVPGAAHRPPMDGVMDMARGRRRSTSFTISRSYLTISWIISVSRLLNTPVLRSFCTLWIRMEFFLPVGRKQPAQIQRDVREQGRLKAN